MRIICIVTILCAQALWSDVSQKKQQVDIKPPLKELLSSLAQDAPLKKNPLHGYDLENYQSRSYLYYYRAAGYFRLAKENHDKLLQLRRAQNDLREAKSAPHYNGKRIDELSTDVTKAMIDIMREQKLFSEVIATVEQLPEKLQQDERYVVYYAQALFICHSDDFRKFARSNLSTLTNAEVIKRTINDVPPWNDVLIVLATENEQTIKPPKSTAHALSVKEELLKDPAKNLDRLKRGTFFKDTNALFNKASDLYFATYKKPVLNAQEKKFVATFRRKMYDFSPQFIDKLITSFWKNSDLKIAEVLSNAFLNKFESHPFTSKVLYDLGRLQEDSQNYLQSAKSYKKFLAHSDDTTYLEPARFRIAWVSYLAKREKEAKQYFEEYLKNHPEGQYASTSEYFLLRMALAKDGQEKVDAVVSFIDKYPLNLYAYILLDEQKLSHDVIRKVLAQEDYIKNGNKFDEFKANIKTLKQLKIYKELKDFELIDDAALVLHRIIDNSNDDKLSLFLASEFQAIKNTHGEVKSLIKVANTPSALRELIPWKNLFPEYRRDLVVREMTEQNLNVSPYLVISLIRQESLFDGAAHSSANAMGLMQLIAGTAQNAAKKIKLANFSLTNEEDNLKLGIKVFGDLLKKYKRIDYALCAYNAGETPTKLWISLRGHLEPIMFIESIPYPQTRKYVKSILRNRAIYEMLYEKQPTQLVSYHFENETIPPDTKVAF